MTEQITPAKMRDYAEQLAIHLVEAAQAWSEQNLQAVKPNQSIAINILAADVLCKSMAQSAEELMAEHDARREGA